MKVLIIGSGGREHALAWKVRQSPHVRELFCAPGNPGIGTIATLVDIKANDLEGLHKFVLDEKIDLTIVGPEQPLIDGIVDLFEERGCRIFGPRRDAALLEGSKIFAKQFMKKYQIPTAEFHSFTFGERFDAERYINEIPAPIVIKADGLAAGKGVSICETKEQALGTLDKMMNGKIFGQAGMNIVIEEYLEGEEASILVLTDGNNFVLLPPAQDHKRIFDNDKGKNTGGMGAYAPTPVVNEEIVESVKSDIVRPVLKGLALEGRNYKGCLYVGLMLTQTGPKVVEFNCRFGDPETQVILPLLEDDFVELVMNCIDGALTRNVTWRPQTAVCIVIASGGYPDHYDIGKPILGLDTASAERDVVIFHAGTQIDHRTGTLVTAGGRVLGVTALGSQNNLEETIGRAYHAVEKITFDGAYYRSDIGKRAVRFLQKSRDTEHS